MHVLILMAAVSAFPAQLTATYNGDSVAMIKVLDATDGIGHHAEQSWTDDAGTIHYSPIVAYRADYRGGYLFWVDAEHPIGERNPANIRRSRRFVFSP